MVEFAIVAPLFFLVLFGIIDFGRALYYSNQLNNAAREGGRIAILADRPCNLHSGTPTGSTCPTTNQNGVSVCEAIEKEGSLVNTWNCSDSTGGGNTLTGCSGASVACVEIDQFTTSSGPSGPCSGSSTNVTPRSSGNKAIQVTIKYFYRPWTPFVSKFFPSSFAMTSTACVRAEY